MTDVSSLGSTTWTWSGSGTGSGFVRSEIGCGSCGSERESPRVSPQLVKPQARIPARPRLPTWSASGSRSGSMSVTVTSNTSQTTWRTSSWSERRNALCFWICSETVTVHCRERLVSWSCHLLAPPQAKPATPTPGFGKTSGMRGRDTPITPGVVPKQLGEYRWQQTSLVLGFFRLNLGLWE